MIQLTHCCLSYGQKTIFNNISCILQATDRIGLVGINGSGKTTFLKAMQNPSILDDGIITIQKNKTLAYMPQEVVLTSRLSVLEETYSAFNAVVALEDKIQCLEEQLQQVSTTQLLEEYSSLQEEYALYDRNSLLSKTKKMLMGLGFKESGFEQPVDQLSGGWKMRIVLAKLLLQEADFYLFDEPTNHLDLDAKEWFLSFLKHQASFGFLLICHERYFLDEVCQGIIELRQGNAHFYKGNYSTYLEQKFSKDQAHHKAYELQQKQIKSKQATIDRFKAGTKAKMAKSMQKNLERMELLTVESSAKKVRFLFPPLIQPGKIVLTVHNVSYGFGTTPLFSNISLSVERGAKVALIAPNGVGKTTLFNIISGQLTPQKGSIEFGYNVHSALFAQDQNSILRSCKTILESLHELCPGASEATIRSLLGSFLFSAQDVYKKINVLSGGEKNRVGMASVLLQNANFLLLDEPTNHLDIESKEQLLKALQDYKGTIIFVSHDRDFISNLATAIIELTPTHALYYPGSYASFCYYKAHQPLKRAAQSAQSSCIVEKKASTPQLSQIEHAIKATEQKIKRGYEEFGSYEYGSEEFEALSTKIEKLSTELKELEIKWEQHKDNQ